MRLLAILLLLPATGLALGPGAGVEFHQLEIDGGFSGKRLKSEFTVYRVALVDNGGLLAGVLLTLGSGAKGLSIETKREVGPVTTKETTTWTSTGEGAQRVDVSDVGQGWTVGTVRTAIRLNIEYAFSADEGDVQLGREPVGQTGVDFSEVRFLVGGTVGLPPMLYLDFNLLDLIWRDLRWDHPGSPILDRFLWQIDLEAGVGVDGLRAGLFAEWDMVGLVDAIFDDAPGGSAYGITARANLHRFLWVEAKLKEYELHTGQSAFKCNDDECSSGGDVFDAVTGRSLSIFAALEI